MVISWKNLNQFQLVVLVPRSQGLVLKVPKGIEFTILGSLVVIMSPSWAVKFIFPSF